VSPHLVTVLLFAVYLLWAFTSPLATQILFGKHSVTRQTTSEKPVFAKPLHELQSFFLEGSHAAFLHGRRDKLRIDFMAGEVSIFEGLVAQVFTVFGGGMVYLLLLSIVTTIQLMTIGVSGPATVIGCDIIGGKETSYHLQYRFTVPDTNREYISWKLASEADCVGAQPGSTIAIRYLPSDPEAVADPNALCIGIVAGPTVFTLLTLLGIGSLKKALYTQWRIHRLKRDGVALIGQILDSQVKLGRSIVLHLSYQFVSTTGYTITDSVEHRVRRANLAPGKQRSIVILYVDDTCYKVL